jgi:hypothetical protein
MLQTQRSVVKTFMKKQNIDGTSQNKDLFEDLIKNILGYLGALTD